MTTIPPSSQTNMLVGTVSSPRCSNTIAGLLRSPHPRRCRRCLPTTPVGLRQDLVLCRETELGKRAKVNLSVVSPDPSGRRNHGILPSLDPRIVEIPITRVHDDFIPHFHGRYF